MKNDTDMQKKESVSAPHPVLKDYYEDESTRRQFVRGIFDRTAQNYDKVERMMAFGSGSWHRRQCLLKAGLKPGMDVLDVAMGTGLVAREAISITGDPSHVIGLDPSSGMLAEARKALSVEAIQAMGEHLPVADNRFDFLSMGYALRHLSNLETVFAEFYRVLKPGATVCILEITRPKGQVSLLALKAYMKGLVPLLTRLTTRHKETALLFEYYWDTIEACVPPEKVIQALKNVGFENANRRVELGIFSAYTGTKPTA